MGIIRFIENIVDGFLDGLSGQELRHPRPRGYERAHRAGVRLSTNVQARASQEREALFKRFTDESGSLKVQLKSIMQQSFDAQIQRVKETNVDQIRQAIEQAIAQANVGVVHKGDVMHVEIKVLDKSVKSAFVRRQRLKL